MDTFLELVDSFGPLVLALTIAFAFVARLNRTHRRMCERSPKVADYRRATGAYSHQDADARREAENLRHLQARADR